MERLPLCMLTAILSGLSTSYGNCTVLAIGTSSENEWTFRVKLEDGKEKVLTVPMYYANAINALNSGLLNQ